ncbi:MULTISPECIES: hypothetical protein [Bacillus]|uniref:hypothetical protein n=1 Tax=Bacillus TaxID=1386 RepID=UPI0013D3E635|nr:MULTISPECIES: hypothetical protein [Bacillus]MDI6565590.1 hypothetical protein [Bacillus subtilis]
MKDEKLSGKRCAIPEVNTQLLMTQEICAALIGRTYFGCEKVLLGMSQSRIYRWGFKVKEAKGFTGKCPFWKVNTQLLMKRFC